MAGGLTSVAVVLGFLVAAPVGSTGGSMALVFERTWSGSGVTDVGVGPDGSVYLAGSTVVGEYPLIDLDATLIKWSADGALLWGRQWRGSADEEATGVAVDAAGAAYVTGTTSSFGGVSEAFLLKFDGDGTLVWQRTWGGPREDGGRGVAIGPDGSVYVAGITQSFGSYFGAAAFLLKFTPDGTLVWERDWQVPGGTFPEAVAISSDGAVYVVGSHGFDAGTRPFLAKFTPEGVLTWDRVYRAPGFVGHDTAVFRGIGATPDGGVVAVGRWMPTFDEEVLVVRFSASGEMLYDRQWGGDSHEEAVDATVAPDGTAYVAGRTNTFKQGTYEDIFVLKVLATGRATEARTWGGLSRDVARGSALGTNGDLYVGGNPGPAPYTFRSAPSQMFRVRGAVAAAGGVVLTPEGALGTPAGTASPLSGTAADGGFSVLLRIRPT